MKITDIRPQIKRANRYSVFVDKKYTFSLGESELIRLGIHSGQEVSVTEIETFKGLSKLDKIYGLAIQLVVRRPRSEKELRDYLRRKGHDEDATMFILNKLTMNGLVDDEAFATSWVANRRLLKPTSLLKLRLELRQKGISAETIEKVLAEDEVSDSSVLMDIIARKRRQTKYQDDMKLMQYLARQGFGYGDIKSALTDKD